MFKPKYGKYKYEFDVFEGIAFTAEQSVHANLLKSTSRQIEGWELVSHEVSFFNVANDLKGGEKFLQTIIWKKDS
jgi:hypothetical protein